MTKEEIASLEEALLDVQRTILNNRKKAESRLVKVMPNHQQGALNLIDYMSMRSIDFRTIQGRLSSLGLSSFSHSERYVWNNLTNILNLLALLGGKQSDSFPMDAQNDFGRTLSVLGEHTNHLFGEGNPLFKQRIMVTLPTESHANYEYIRKLIESGMHIARINTSHDDEHIWLQMIEHVRKAEKETGLSCKIYMDLAGPKLRTNQLFTLSKKGNWKLRNSLKMLPGDRILLIGSEKNLPIVDKPFSENKEERPDIPQKCISITMGEIIPDIRVGDSVWFDDGKIGGEIIAAGTNSVEVLVTQLPSYRIKLKREKGINFPDSILALPSLTVSDVEILPFLTTHADIVGYSFVRYAKDVEALLQAFERLNRPDIGLVLKIENREAFNHLPDLLLTAMRHAKVGVMIARGDLSVELGAQRISEVQEEILWLCEAAMIPTIWATQVLENLAKNGIATRAEITDASASARAECVMLNKGANILGTVEMLTRILTTMEAHHNKKQGTLRKLAVASRFFDQLTLQTIE